MITTKLYSKYPLTMCYLRKLIENFFAAAMLAHNDLSWPTTTTAHVAVSSSVVTSNLEMMPADSTA